jgi:hypothetical protein
MFSLFLMAALALSPTPRCQCSYHSCYCEDSCSCSASTGKLCDKKCPCDFAFVRADDPKPHLPTPPCPNCQCGCPQTGKCNCKDCDHPLLVKGKAQPIPPAPQVAPVETKSCPADDSGTAFFLDGKQCGWLCHAEMKYYPMLPSGNFGAACPIPKGATACKPVASVPGTSGPPTTFDFGASGSACGPNGCGSSSTGRGGLFGRRH